MPTAILQDRNQSLSHTSQAPSIKPRVVEHSIDQNYAPEFKESDKTVSMSSMAQFNIPKLKRMLKQYGEFPEMYRPLTWKYLLKLPLNKEAF